MSSFNEFSQPWTAGRNKDYSDNINYNVGTTVRFAWFESVKDVKLLLVQDNHPFDAQGGPDVTIDNSISGTNYEWTVSYEGLDPNFNNVFYLTITGDDGCNSHYFNISDRDVNPTPSSSTPPTNLPTSTTTSSTSTSSSPTTTTTGPPSTNSDDTSESDGSAPTVTVTSSANSSNSGSLSAGPVAGIAVGVVLGVLALAAGLFFLWKRKKSLFSSSPSSPPQELDASQQQQQQQQHPFSSSQHFSSPDMQQQYQQQASPVSELMDQRHYVAADGNVYQYPEEMGGGTSGGSSEVYEVPGAQVRPVYEADGKMLRYS